MDIMKNWLAKPHQIEPQMLRWQADYPDLVELDIVEQYIGLNTYAVTVTDKNVKGDNKEKLVFAVPHAHEPAGTVACMDFVNQLLTGNHLDGSVSDIPNREAILENCILSFIPDANPDGRSRAPRPARCPQGRRPHA